MSKEVKSIEEALEVLKTLGVAWKTVNRIQNSLWDTGVAFFNKINLMKPFKGEGRTMKRTIIILITVLALSVAGVLYGSHDQSESRQTLSLVEAYTAQFPETMPDVILDPMVGFLLY